MMIKQVKIAKYRTYVSNNKELLKYNIDRFFFINDHMREEAGKIVLRLLFAYLVIVTWLLASLPVIALDMMMMMMMARWFISYDIDRATCCQYHHHHLPYAL